MATALTQLPILSSRMPVSTELVPAWVRGETANRLMVILRAPGCAYDLRPQGGCTYCGFRNLTTDGVPVAATDLIAQVETALRSWDCDRERIHEIDVYNSGNFLNDAEIPEEARRAILGRCARESAVRVIVVESRPEYITGERLAAMQEAVQRPQPLALEVAIGLDAFDDFLRERGLRKGFTRRAFERAVGLLGETRADLLVYLMLKPVEMKASVALMDVERAAEYVHSVAARNRISTRIALEPTFVVPHTPLARDFLAGRYSPPSLWVVVEAVKRIAPYGPLTVGLWDEGLNPLAVPSSCHECRERVLSALRLFNLTQDTVQLEIPTCRCADSTDHETPVAAAASRDLGREAGIKRHKRICGPLFSLPNSASGSGLLRMLE